MDKVHVKAGKKCTLGLAPTCNMVVSHPSVSRQHARLEADDEFNLTIEDLGSTHGYARARRDVIWDADVSWCD